ncbi:[protein-PII] uridylyltransferase [Thalassotalea marina]|uniref:Bifunctional uridylyltransferase/uridylyl-removing enzyme n=1 Tax=Thalassotalea marina TaxID=1673741 RepID=A0A919BM42_9GAMM|nr:[protein-PII] uridylyltransferase [Thalassotalea marina]GHF98461.1 bifunctional uridylyltransferase/uridylyl-removing enzyme [Thalassotalea marina]
MDITKRFNFDDPKSIKEGLAHFAQQQNESFFESKIELLQNQRAALFDELLIALWCEFDLHIFDNLSLNAVGGYGRHTLHPYSDIDICILFDSALSDIQEQQLSGFLTKLWDFGVDIGHAVRSEAQNVKAAKSDITVATNLLDIRTLAGNRAHAKNVLTGLYSDDIISDEDFYTQKAKEQQERHVKAKNTALFLEPNIKNNPGGLRDVQTIIWIARKYLHVADAQSLKKLGFFKNDEFFELIEAYHFVCRLRWALHSVAKRPLEVLLFDYQADVAKFMKFGHGDNAQLAVEKMMRQLFRAMTRIRELNQMMVGMIKQQLNMNVQNGNEGFDIDEHFFVAQGMIQAKYDEVFFNKVNVIRLFRLIAEYQEIHDIAPETLRLLRQTRRSLLGELQDYQECRQEFLAIIKHQNGLQRAFSLMHRYGILASYFPEWKAIEGQMQFDMHNAYTVDEHAFKLIQHLESFSQIKERKNLIRSIYKQSSLKHILVIAGLCHDLSGKQTHENNELSALYAKEFALLHDLKRTEVELIHWLVENQFLLISTLQTLDIHDPEVIKSVAKSIRTESRLNALYCFTVADLQATNDHTWNDWQESLLNKLYLALRAALKNGIENVFHQRTLIRENKQEALVQLSDLNYCAEQVQQLWSVIPSSFFVSNQLNEIIEFSQQLLNKNDTQNVVSLSDNTNLECTDLLVYANDRSMLFVDLFNSLASLKVKVKEAQLYKTKNGKVLEVIKILDHNDEPIVDPYRSEKIVDRINQVLNGDYRLDKPMKPRFVNNFDNSPEVEFLNSVNSKRALLRVNALDTPSVIEKICDVFKRNQFTVHSAKISSLGESSENVFSISTKESATLTVEQKETLIKELVDNIA